MNDERNSDNQEGNKEPKKCKIFEKLRDAHCVIKLYALISLLIICDVLVIAGMVSFLCWNVYDGPNSIRQILAFGFTINFLFVLFFIATFFAFSTLHKDVNKKRKSDAEQKVDSLNNSFLEVKQKEWEEALKNLENKVKDNETKS